MGTPRVEHKIPLSMEETGAAPTCLGRPFILTYTNVGEFFFDSIVANKCVEFCKHGQGEMGG
jgi:hypothetical protein